ncbi:MAG: tetratricopeptide repeat protein [Acidobacteria bacterium]|nr:tetratricopeptide repeat protein [Acidobacteriota bacterium]
MLYKEQAEGFAAEGDPDAVAASYLLAAGELRKAVQQLSGAPDAITIYQMLGDCYERAGKWAEAIKVYEEFLKIFPDVNEAEMFRSFIVQARKRM